MVDAALYHPTLGFYSSGGGRAGRAGGDFITSPEVGPLFGAVVGRALDGWWHRLGEPDPFVVVEAGAGRGALALAVLRAAPSCLPALRYVLVERSDPLRSMQGEHLDLEDPANAFGPVSEGERGEPAEALKGRGPVVVSVPDLPGVTVTGVVMANELLDNLPFRLLERADGEWREVRVDLGSGGGLGAGLVETTVAAHPTLAGMADQLAPGAPPGARVPIQRAVAEWLRDARGVLRRGAIVCWDYGDTTAGMAERPWQEWVRTYREHQRGSHPLEDLGLQDITCEVALDQLATVLGKPKVSRQQDWLAAHGMEELVEEGRRRWEESAAAPDLAAMEARSRVREAEALADPAGLGAHHVLEWKAP